MLLGGLVGRGFLCGSARPDGNSSCIGFLFFWFWMSLFLEVPNDEARQSVFQTSATRYGSLEYIRTQDGTFANLGMEDSSESMDRREEVWKWVLYAEWG